MGSWGLFSRTNTVFYSLGVAFIRRVRTASGATAVQIAQCSGPRQRILKHLGSAHTEAQLGVLLDQARRLLEHPAQTTLKLGVEPTPQVVPLLGVAGEPGLFEAGQPGPQVVRDRPGAVAATDS